MYASLQDLPHHCICDIVAYSEGNDHLGEHYACSACFPELNVSGHIVLSAVCKAWLRVMDGFGYGKITIKAEKQDLKYIAKHILSSPRGRMLLANTNSAKFTSYNPLIIINSRAYGDAYEGPHAAISEWIAMQDVLAPKCLIYEGMANSGHQGFMSGEICVDRLRTLTIAFEDIDLFDWMESILERCCDTLESLTITGSVHIPSQRDILYSPKDVAELPTFPKLRHLNVFRLFYAVDHQLLAHIVSTSPIKSLECEWGSPEEFQQVVLPLAGQLVHLDCEYYLPQYGHNVPLLRSLGMSECLLEEGAIRIPPLPQHVTKLGISLIEETNTSLIEQIFDESGYAPGLQTLIIKSERALVLDDHREAVSDLLQACKARDISLLWETTGEAVLPEEPENVEVASPYAETWRFKRSVGMLKGADAKYNKRSPAVTEFLKKWSSRELTPDGDDENASEDCDDAEWTDDE